MANGKQWQNEINKMAKDDLTVFLHNIKSLLNWKFFAKEFQLDPFARAVAAMMESRIERIADAEAQKEEENYYKKWLRASQNCLGRRNI